MDNTQAYASRLEAEMRAADARLDQMEAEARARNARADMNEISGLRQRQNQIKQQVATGKTELQGDWSKLRQRVDANWNDLRGDIAERHYKTTAWDDARERRFN